MHEAPSKSLERGIPVGPRQKSKGAVQNFTAAACFSTSAKIPDIP
jgi:hypothetical protein